MATASRGEYWRGNPLGMRVLGYYDAIVEACCPWRDLPAEFGGWNTVFKRFRDWVKGDVVT